MCRQSLERDFYVNTKISVLALKKEIDGTQNRVLVCLFVCVCVCVRVRVRVLVCVCESVKESGRLRKVFV